jgi:MarR family transcriptional regulator, negative regulator of the multidrug operon emrRAB
VLGALALAVSDRVQAAAEEVSGHGASGPAALAALDGFAAGGSIDELRRALGITHSGTVRLVDRLAAARLVERRVGSDARTVSIHLTHRGRRIARRVAVAREGALEAVVAGLAQERRELLLSLMAELLAGLDGDRRRVCRLCDREACRRGARGCPIWDQL